ncbi:MAG: TetR family transcriptional regulator [Frankiales bacterium]|nr:TetR family transcriptional regulator [Frankiales bacterium]
MTQELLTPVGLLPARPDLSGAKLRLFESALELFGRRGYHAVSVRDLMATLGQQPGALYAHVPSKQHLLHELMAIGQDTHLACLKEALLDSGRDPADQVRALVEAHVRVHLDFPALARVTSRELESLSPEQMAAVMAVRAESTQLFIDVIERGIRLGDFVAPTPLLAVNAIGAMGIRAAEWWTPASPHSIDEVAHTYAGFAVKLLT